MRHKIIGDEILTRGDDGLWRTRDGVVNALEDDSEGADDVVR